VGRLEKKTDFLLYPLCFEKKKKKNPNKIVKSFFSPQKFEKIKIKCSYLGLGKKKKKKTWKELHL
jgi:hypothetical protein